VKRGYLLRLVGYIKKEMLEGVLMESKVSSYAGANGFIGLEKAFDYLDERRCVYDLETIYLFSNAGMNNMCCSG